MGYFANGTEGDWYERFICERCIHSLDENGCAVWGIHFLHNGTDNPEVEGILNEFIPRQGTDNLLCSMWKSLVPEYDDLPEQYAELLKRKEARNE